MRIVVSRCSAINLSHQDLSPARRGSIGFEPSNGEDAASRRVKNRGRGPYRKRMTMISQESKNKYGVPANPNRGPNKGHPSSVGSSERESEVSAATAINMHEAAVRLGSDDIIYSQAIEPTRHPVDDSALIAFDNP